VKTRVLTAVVLAPIVLGALFLANPYPLLILAAACAYIGGREVSNLLGHNSHAAGAVASLAILLAPRTSDPALLSVIAFSLFLVGVLSAWRGAGSNHSFWIPLSLLWCAAPLYSLVLLHGGDHTELWRLQAPILLAILPLWGGDTAAIFAGQAFGKHLLAPGISPKKTVEGAIANLLACIVVAIGIGYLIEFDLLPSSLCGLAAGTFGQAGDLFESYVKRKAGVKDSGNLLPGHGGLMDRIDSILFTAPAVAVIVTFWARK
jgi:phosphatidate cytidylyltransferase